MKYVYIRGNYKALFHYRENTVSSWRSDNCITRKIQVIPEVQLALLSQGFLVYLVPPVLLVFQVIQRHHCQVDQAIPVDPLDLLYQHLPGLYHLSHLVHQMDLEDLLGLVVLVIQQIHVPQVNLVDLDHLGCLGFRFDRDDPAGPVPATRVALEDLLLILSASL